MSTLRANTQVFVSPDDLSSPERCALITGGYPLPDSNDTAQVNATVLIAQLKLLPIRIFNSVNLASLPSEQLDQVTLSMKVVNPTDAATLTLTMSDGQSVGIQIEENSYGITPIEMARIARELSDYLNVQLYVIRNSLRVTWVDYSWIEETEPMGVIQQTSRLMVNRSVWDSVLSDPMFCASTILPRSSKLTTSEVSQGY